MSDELESGAGDNYLRDWQMYTRNLEGKVAALRAERAALLRDKERLLKFAGKAVLTHAEGGEWDGFELQDALEVCGLLVPQEMAAPCDPERCVCGEVGDFPLTCYRQTTLGIEARDAAMREET